MINKLCKNYYDMIIREYGTIIQSTIIYGSNIYNCSSSDLDVCLIVNNYDKALQDEIIKKTKSFHLLNKLKVDEEIPFENKLIYSEKEVLDTLEHSPFEFNGNIIIKDIVKTKEFLSSVEMKKRLLLNILTTDHLTIGKSTENYERIAWKIILTALKEYYLLQNMDIENILTYLYKNPYTGAEGEMYLGYKKNRVEKEMYLKRKLGEML